MALLAEARGEFQKSVAHFEKAVLRLEQLDAKPYLCRTRYEFARTLLAHQDPANTARALQLLELAKRDAESLKLSKLLQLIDARLASSTKTQSVSPSGHAAGSPTFSLHCEGEYWSLIWDGAPVRLKDSRGQRMLSRLIGEPDREIHVRELAQDTVLDDASYDARDADGDAGEHLDEHARKAYAERRQTLRDEIERAETFNDVARAERLRAELEFLNNEIARAVGLGGRARRAGSANERARVAVQRRIRDAIRRIAVNASSNWRPLGCRRAYRFLLRVSPRSAQAPKVTRKHRNTHLTAKVQDRRLCDSDQIVALSIRVVSGEQLERFSTGNPTNSRVLLPAHTAEGATA